MQTVKIDLGGLELESKVSGLRLRLSSEARFAPSAEDDIDTLREKLTLYELTTHSVDWPWITRGNDFRLEILSQVEDLAAGEAQGDLVDVLTAQLRTAKLWYQLHLIPFAIEASIPRKDTYLLSVSLAHDETVTQGSTKHKLANNLFPHGIQSSDEALTATLDSVCLRIQIEGIRSRKRRRLQRRCSEPAISEHANESLCSNAKETIPMHSKSSDLLLHCEDEDGVNDDTYTLLDFESGDRLRPHRRSPSAPSLRKRNCATSDIEHSPPGVNKVMELVDAAIRMAISDCRKDLGKGTRLTATDSLRHLSHVAPAIWCPDYLPAIANRGMFIPTISSALETVCTRSVTSTKLRDYGVSKLFASQCWQTLRRGAYESSRGKRLRSLAPSGGLKSVADQQLDDILDPNHENLFCNGTVKGDRDGDEDILFDVDFDTRTDGFEEEISEDDMLSACESSDSLAISEEEVEELDDFQWRDEGFDAYEMLCI